MFTGIVRATGTVAEIRALADDACLRIESRGLPWTEYAEGESIAVNGVCLTAGSLDDGGFRCDVSRETLAVTTLGDWRPGRPVNLEPSLSLGERLGGHLVSGHVDGVGTVAERREVGGSLRLRIELPAGLGRYVARKGSVCVDGVSLTINAVSGNSFAVNIIPHTARETIAGGYRAGSRVNVEVDLIARYLERLTGEAGGRDDYRSFLEANGYA